jgi:dihydrofolate reductase
VRISLIAAASENNVIGNRGRIPWTLPDDLRHFRKVTEGHPVIMGRKTYESIGHPLPNRRNIVITRQKGFAAGACDVVSSLDEALLVADKDGEDDIFVIGGGEIYREALPRAERIYLTRVHAEVPGDAHFPEFHPDHWMEVSAQRHEADTEHAYPYTFLVYERRL